MQLQHLASWLKYDALRGQQAGQGSHKTWCTTFQITRTQQSETHWHMKADKKTIKYIIWNSTGIINTKVTKKHCAEWRNKIQSENTVHAKD
jgi:hypothetical protein